MGRVPWGRMPSTPKALRLSVSEDAGEVSALLDRPRGAFALLVLAHGAGAGMQHSFMQAITQALTERKLAVLRYQFPYMEAGRRRPDPKPRLLATVRAAVAEGRRRARGLPLLAGGKSMGGRMTSTAASRAPLPGVRGLVFVGFPLHPAGKPGTERADHLREVDAPMLFCQGTRDKLAELPLIEQVLGPMEARARLHVVDDGDHSFAVRKTRGHDPAAVIPGLADAVEDWARTLVGD